MQSSNPILSNIIYSKISETFEIVPQIESSFPEEYLYLNITPNFKKIHLDHLKTPKKLLKLENLCSESKNPYSNMILGLLSEYGINSPINYKKSLEYYQKGADNNDAYSLYRLFYIYRNDYEKFGLEKNYYMQFSCLFKSAAYFDEKDNRFSDRSIDPILHLAVFFETNKSTMENLIDYYIRSLALTDEIISQFLSNWFLIKFPSNENEKKNAIEKQKILALKNSEAAYHIGDNHRWGGETLDKNTPEAIKYLTIAAKFNLAKAIESLAIIYIEDNDYDNATLWLSKGTELGSYLCIKFLGEYQISGKLIPLNIEAGLKKLKKAFYIGDFWAAWTIIIVYKYIKEISDEYRLKKIYKYSDILFSSKDIMGNIVYITIRHSSLASCYEKAICVPKDLNKALKLHLDCLVEIKRECWKGYTYYKIGKLYEKLDNIDRSRDYYFKGFKARAEFIKKEVKKEPPHYYNYAKMFEYGRGVHINLHLAYKYYKLGAEFNSFLSFHLVYGKKCENRLFEIEKKINDNLLISNFTSSFHQNEQKIPIIERKSFELTEKIDFVNEKIDMFYGNDSGSDSKIFKNLLIYKFHSIEYEKYWYLLNNIFILQKYVNLTNKYPRILAICPQNKEREIYLLCNNDPKFNSFNFAIKTWKIASEIKAKIITNIISFNYKNFILEEKQLLIKNFNYSSLLISEKDPGQIFFNLPFLLVGEGNNIDEQTLMNDVIGLVKEIYENDKKLKNINELNDPIYKKLSNIIYHCNSNKVWNFEELQLQLSNVSKSVNKTKFFNF